MCVRNVDVQCVLQFTLLHAVGCVLHRPTSRVIHRSELCLRGIFTCNFQMQATSPIRGLRSLAKKFRSEIPACRPTWETRLSFLASRRPREKKRFSHDLNKFKKGLQPDVWESFWLADGSQKQLKGVLGGPVAWLPHRNASKCPKRNSAGSKATGIGRPPAMCRPDSGPGRNLEPSEEGG